MIKIKDFSEKTDFSIRMLRYLEEVSLLIPDRDSNNYRVYRQEQVEEAQWIKKLQNLGIQLKEIESINLEDAKKQICILKDVLKREQDIAEIKSESIPILKSIINYLETNESSIKSYFQNSRPLTRKMRTLGGDEKFHRTAFSIPILRNIYEDHLAIESNLELIATDLMKFGQWFEECSYEPEVFNVLNESAFVFGNNLTDDFINGYENSWQKYLPKMGFKKLNDFIKADVRQLMGTHDIIIRTTFKFKDSGDEGEIVIPYTPIYTMSELSKKN